MSHAPLNSWVWYKAFLRWVWAQDRSPDTPDIPKNASGLVGIYPPKKEGTSSARR